MFRLIGVMGLILTVSGCGDMTKADWQALADASCSMSMNCNPSTLPSPAASQSGLLNGLDYSYRDRGNIMCVYKDGSVVNIGVGICPLNL